MTPNIYFDFIDTLSNTSSVEEFHTACSALAQELGYDYFLYGARFPTSYIRPTIVIISGYPDAWNQWYTGNQYDQIDPIVEHCVTRITPLNWNTTNRMPEASRAVHRFLSEARDIGLNAGTSFPLHGYGGEKALLSLVTGNESRQAKAFMRESTPYAHALLPYVHEAMRRIVSQQKPEFSQVKLTLREKECLLWAADGKTAWETSQILGISERTTNYHLQNAAKKMGVANRQHAIARAIAQGLIIPQPH